MKTVILCGGLGTRLREETEYRPKPLVDVGGYPILWHIMRIYANAGFNEFVLCLGYRGDMIKEYFVNYEVHQSDFTLTLGRGTSGIEYHDAHKEQGFRITMAETGANTMTGGRIRRIRRYIDDDTFMVTYGDGLSDVNPADVLEFHRSHGRLATMTAVRTVSRFGMIEADSSGVVTEFAEKPISDDWMNAGFFVFNKKVFDYLKGDETILERDPLERLAAERQLMAFRHEGFFFAMDTYREFKHLNDLWAAGKAPWKVWTE